MHSPETPEPEKRERILTLTLAKVRERRIRRRRGAAAGVLLVAGFAAGILWWQRLPSIPSPEGARPGLAHVPQTPEPAPASASVAPVIERIPMRPLRTTVRIKEPATMDRIAHDPSIRQRIELISDAQLLAELPPDQPAGLLRRADGTATLVFLR